MVEVRVLASEAYLLGPYYSSRRCGCRNPVGMDAIRDKIFGEELLGLGSASRA